MKTFMFDGNLDEKRLILSAAFQKKLLVVVLSTKALVLSGFDYV